MPASSINLVVSSWLNQLGFHEKLSVVDSLAHQLAHEICGVR